MRLQLHEPSVASVVSMKDSELLEKARECLEIEASAIRQTSESLDGNFVETARIIAECTESGHKLVFSGVGKNEPICQKICATFNSTGVPSVYLDPLKALHGDLGLCQSGDVAFLFSNSGASDELIVLDGFLKRQAVKTIAFTSSKESALAKACDHIQLYAYEAEACPLSLAPTSSTTAALALGDALAMVLLEMRGFKENDFARFHPSGNLGKALLLKVSEVMRKGSQIAVIPESSTIKDAILAITQARCGTVALVDESGMLKGVFSDGDFRRASLKEASVLDTPVAKYMSKDPISVKSESLAVEALRIFQNNRINDLVVIDSSGRPEGLIDGQDLPNLKLV
jgi:arabinose-5-phosphate isomerase